MKEFIKLGNCQKVHGIKGELSFNLLNPSDSILKKNHKLLVKPLPGSKLTEDKEYKILSIRLGNKVICALEGVMDRNEAEEIIPFEFYLSRNDFPKAHDDEYYLSDLIGCLALDHMTLEPIGEIASFYDSGAHDIVVIGTKNGNIELPLVEKFFKEIDIENKKVLVFLPEYV